MEKEEKVKAKEEKARKEAKATKGEKAQPDYRRRAMHRPMTSAAR